MENGIYCYELITRLQTIQETAEQFCELPKDKSAEQLIAEIDMLKMLLNTTRKYLVEKLTSENSTQQQLDVR